ncbi:type II toxin-antitoxin system HicB family antitoxin [Bifidobacterium sp. MA2]|uniref:Type II toxin-antitoxin system HicB family antitoxin n=2 Tax=Bifidobacterium santillanense TaxID=2809028 RepID=A0ABS5ULL3_9BIFI|nr:type II toxin-antitoxin system HicB family antitoxin [Bifidobacterium santillanense]
MPFEDESDGYVVRFPDFDNAVTEGLNLADALYMAQDLGNILALDALEAGQELPEASSLNDLRTKSDADIVTLVLLDPTEYAKRFGNHMVTKEVEVPAWLATWSDKYGIDYSDVLCRRLEAMARRFSDALTDDTDGEADDHKASGSA